MSETCYKGRPVQKYLQEPYHQIHVITKCVIKGLHILLLLSFTFPDYAACCFIDVLKDLHILHSLFLVDDKMSLACHGVNLLENI